MLGLVALGAASLAFVDRDRDTGSPRGRQEAVVIRVVDGDTIIVRVDGREERVRYIGVDAPELSNADTGQPAECGGAEARDANVAMLDGARVELERDVSDRDRFGRLLRHVWVSGTLVGRELARQGAVEARSYPPDTSRDAELDDAERAGRRSGAGIWGSC